MWFGLTIARSSPASTQWWRKTELRIARAFGETPKETFDTPSEVFTPGSSFLMRLMPSIVATADGRHSSSPVVSVKVSASKISASRSSPCSSHASSTMRLATSSLRSGVLAMPTSSIVSAIRAAPWAFASGTTTSSLSRPASRLIELTIARPGDALERGLDHVRLGRVDLDRRGLRERHALHDLAHLLCLVLALGERHADVEHVRSAGHLVLGDLEDAVVVVREQQLLRLARALRVHALAHQGGARLLRQRGGGHHRGDERLARGRARGRVAAADAVHDRPDVVGRRAAAAADDRHVVALHELLEHVRERVGLLGEDRLAVGPLERQAGVRDAVHRHRAVLAEVADRVAHVLGAGRAVQPDHVHVERNERCEHGLDVRAEQHLAAVRQQRDARLDRDLAAGEVEGLARAEDRGLDLEDVLRGLDDEQVGAALDQALGLLGEDLDQLAEGDLAERWVVARGEMARRADRAGHEAVVAGGRARDLGGSAVDLRRVLAEPPLLELQAAGLEGVRLHDLGAGVQHRLVHALDHVRAVEHERLVALALKPAVVLLGQLELLERGTHAAVEHHDAVADCLDVVARCQGRKVTNLDTMCQG